MAFHKDHMNDRTLSPELARTAALARVLRAKSEWTTVAVRYLSWRSGVFRKSRSLLLSSIKLALNWLHWTPLLHERTHTPIRLPALAESPIKEDERMTKRQPIRKCEELRCGRLTAKGRCELHRRARGDDQHGRADQAQKERSGRSGRTVRPDSGGTGMTWSKESSSKRGYGANWRRIRLFVLQRDSYLCQCDHCRGGKLRLTAASEVNHIKPRAWFEDGRATGDADDPSNLQAVNTRCHQRITTAAAGQTTGQRFDARGYPIDEDAPPGGDRLRGGQGASDRSASRACASTLQHSRQIGALCPSPESQPTCMQSVGAYAHNPKRRRRDVKATGAIGPWQERSCDPREVWDELVAGAPQGILTAADRQALEYAVRLLVDMRRDPTAFPASKGHAPGEPAGEARLPARKPLTDESARSKGRR